MEISDAGREPKTSVTCTSLDASQKTYESTMASNANVKQPTSMDEKSTSESPGGATDTSFSSKSSFSTKHNTSNSSKVTYAKRKKGNPLRDVNAPKPPLSAYLMFLRNTRETVKNQNPGLSVNDLTRILGTMWTELPLNKKQVFIDEAEEAKRKYNISLEEYHKSESYKKFIVERTKAIEEAKNEESAVKGNNLVCLPCYQWFENPHNYKEHVKSRKHKRNVIHSQMGKKAKKSEMHNKTSSTSGKSLTTAAPVKSFPDMSDVTESQLEIPIFSDVFLNYNKNRESQLRNLRQIISEYDEQNAILTKHIDHLNVAVEKLEHENAEHIQTIKKLTPFLKKFITSFTEIVSKADIHMDINLSNVEEFIKEYSSMEKSKYLKEFLTNLDYPSCFDENYDDSSR